MAFLCTVVLLGCGGGASEFDRAVAEPMLDVLRYSSSVGLFLLEDGKRVEGPAKLDDHTFDRLARIVLDPKSYVWNGAKACLPDPGAEAVFSDRQGRTVEVLFCFRCKMLMFKDATHSSDWLNFDHKHSELEGIFKAAFPDSEKSKALG